LDENVLKPMHVKPLPKNPQFNYIIDIGRSCRFPKR
jgi:hypothetical protein